jgi:hypothetical protein
MKSTSVSFIAVLTLGLSALRATAQESTDVMQVERAAAEYAAFHFLNGETIALDTSAATMGSLGPSRAARQVAALANALRASRVGPGSQFFHCADSSPKGCRLSGADVLVKIGKPEISADTAFIMLTTWSPSGLSRVPVSRRERRLRATKQSGVWIVTGEIAGGSIT